MCRRIDTRGSPNPQGQLANRRQMCIIWRNHTHFVSDMRTNIDIDDSILEEAMAATGLPTKRATVEAALRQLVTAHRRREAIRAMQGIGWDGDLDDMRRDKPHRR